MTRNLIVRGFDDEIHSQLGDQSKRKGVSINSIVKDAVDQWLKRQNEIPKRHHLLLYDNQESIQRLIKSLDKMTRDDEWFKCFVRSSNTSITDLLEKLEWFDGTIVPYKPSQQDKMKHIKQILQNISQHSNEKEICLVDFLVNDIASSSITEAIHLEKEYDKNRLEGLVFCAYEMNNLFNASTSEMIEMFESHDQVFILNNDQIFKLHLTKENIHKLFLS
ncbi:plasmid partition protein ParG [Candidatus Nitrosocosmicus arcticus]|nr:plasmid partition protein ParG [Candidatus Nitrosocosmicus arcticus]